jgi:hypothetical protein
MPRGRAARGVPAPHLPAAPLGTIDDKPAVRAARLAKAARIVAAARGLPGRLGSPLTPLEIVQRLDGAGRAALLRLAGIKAASEDTWAKYVIPMLRLEEQQAGRDPFAGL